MSSKLLAQLFLSEAKCKVILSKLSLYAYSQWDIKVGTFKKYGKKLSEWQCDRGKYQNPLRFELKGWGKAFVMFNHSWSLCMSLMTDVSVPFMTQLSLIKHYKKDHSNIQIFKAESGGKEGRKAPNTDIFFKIFTWKASCGIWTFFPHLPHLSTRKWLNKSTFYIPHLPNDKKHNSNQNRLVAFPQRKLNTSNYAHNIEWKTRNTSEIDLSEEYFCLDYHSLKHFNLLWHIDMN